jgi:hypothetical protein
MSLKTKTTIKKQNNERLHNATGIATGAAHNLEHLIEEFLSIFTF